MLAVLSPEASRLDPVLFPLGEDGYDFVSEEPSHHVSEGKLVIVVDGPVHLADRGRRACVWNGKPAASRNASRIASLTVGWGCTTSAASATVAPQLVMSAASAISSVAEGPTMWTPTTSPSSSPSLRAITFTWPVSPAIRVRAFPSKLVTVTFTSPNSARACSSVSPTEATSGAQYVTFGISS